ncbi:GDSL-type esterase/lipase family protein [Streptomyces sp. NPDC101166]|uniref:GDSL-type esterase/lipase family protein n=1 Tax=Streptomyces sp. NPDC101166 TaxID=3366120 RepID=UPI0038227251
MLFATALALLVGGVAGPAAGLSEARAVASKQAGQPGLLALNASGAPGASMVTEADGDLRLELDAGVGFDRKGVQRRIDEDAERNPLLSDTIRDQLEKYPVGISDDPKAERLDFDGTVRIEGDTSLSLTVPASEVQTAESWKQYFFAWGMGYLVTYQTTGYCLMFFPELAIACPTLGSFTGNLIRGLLTQVFNHELGSSKAYTKTFLDALKKAFWSHAQARMLAWIEKAVPGLLNAYKTALRNVAISWARTAANWVAERAEEIASLLPDGIAEWGPPPVSALSTVMVVGDSISNGFEGDYTWRYRLWQWSRDQDWGAQFVGPLNGTVAPDKPEAPKPPPPLEDEPPSGTGPSTPRGEYARGVEAAFLNSGTGHYAMWGRRLEQNVPTIKPVMEDMKARGQLPDVLLVELGFNDIGWLGAGADLTERMKQFIDNARKANPDVHLVLANVPQRTTLGSANPELGKRTRAYNAALSERVKEWSTPASPVAIADIDKAMGCDPSATSCDTTYDGLHPNNLGEYRIARAFATTLHDEFGVGTALPADPVEVAERVVGTPKNVKFDGTRQGVTLTWDKVFGVHGYQVQWRDITADPDGEWRWAFPVANRWDMSRQYYGQIFAGHRYELRVRAASGDTVKSAWSGITGGTARPTTPDYPRNVDAGAGPGGGVVQWDPPTGDHSDGITAYAVYLWSKNAAIGIVKSFSVSGTATIAGFPRMPAGDYIVMVAAWNKSGEGKIALSDTITFD